MWSPAVADIGLVEIGEGMGGRSDYPEGRLLQGESYRELANKLASDGAKRGGRWRWRWCWEGWGFI